MWNSILQRLSPLLPAFPDELEDSMPDTSTILIRNGTVVTCVGEDLHPHHFPADVLIQSGVIVAVTEPGASLPSHGQVTVIDATDKLVCPGFVDSHRHVWEGAFKYMGDWTLMEYVAKCIQVLPPLLDPSSAGASQMLGNLEALNAGVTTVVDHCHLTSSPEVFDALLDATRRSGIRSFMCYGRWEEWPNGSGRKGWQMKQLAQIAREGTGSDRVTLGLAIDGFGDEYFKELEEELFPFAKKHGIDVISTHVVGGPNGIGQDTVAQLVQRGILDRPILFVHGNNMEPEFHHLRSSGSSISSTPEVELVMSHGEPIGLLADEAQVRVGLGIDCSSVVSGDMFSAMRSLLSHQRGKDNAKLKDQGKLPLYLKSRSGDAFRLATIGGARAIHREASLGSIEVGKKADILLVDTLTPSMLGAERDPVQAMVIHCTPSDISMVLVDGEIVVDKTKSSAQGAFTRVVWSDQVKEVRAALDRVRDKLKNWDQAEEEKYAELRKLLCMEDVMVPKY